MKTLVVVLLFVLLALDGAGFALYRRRGGRRLRLRDYWWWLPVLSFVFVVLVVMP